MSRNPPGSLPSGRRDDDGAGTIRVRALILSILPLPVLYAVFGVAALMARIAGWRRGFVDSGLRRCLPDSTDAERGRVATQFYSYLGELVAESVHGMRISQDDLVGRLRFENAEVVEQALRDGKRVLLLTAHLCNWEWLVLRCSTAFGVPLVAAFKPASRERADRELTAMRSRFGAVMVAAKQVVNHIIAQRGAVKLLALVADQSPAAKSEQQQWVSFSAPRPGFSPVPAGSARDWVFSRYSSRCAARRGGITSPGSCHCSRRANAPTRSRHWRPMSARSNPRCASSRPGTSGRTTAGSARGACTTDGWRLRCCYAIGGLLAWLAYRVIGLRRSVIHGNLERSFPEWPNDRVRAVTREFSRRQGELVAEALYASAISEAELRERVTITNPEVMDPGDPPRTLVLVGAHHGNFEWLLYRLSLEFPARFAGLYKPGRSVRVDGWLKRRRARFGARLISAKSVLRELAGLRDAAAVGLVADQVPRTSPEKHWCTFSARTRLSTWGPRCSAARCARA